MYPIIRTSFRINMISIGSSSSRTSVSNLVAVKLLFVIKGVVSTLPTGIRSAFIVHLLDMMV